MKEEEQELLKFLAFPLCLAERFRAAFFNPVIRSENKQTNKQSCMRFIRRSCHFLGAKSKTSSLFPVSQQIYVQNPYILNSYY